MESRRPIRFDSVFPGQGIAVSSGPNQDLEVLVKLNDDQAQSRSTGNTKRLRGDEIVVPVLGQEHFVQFPVWDDIVEINEVDPNESAGG